MKKKKNNYIDDGHTIYNMDVDGMPGRKEKKGNISLTKKEKRALIGAAFQYYFPIFLGVMLCFFVALLIVYFWLK